MSKGKYSRKRGMNLRPLILVLTVALLLGATIGGTIAWLTATTQKVENTFTVGDVAITLLESELKLKDNGDVDYDADGDMQYKDPAPGVTGNYPLIPGNVYKKDPVVTVTANSEKCYLFVEVVEKNTPSAYLEYTLNSDGWTTNESGLPENVWYKVVEKSSNDQSWHLIQNDQVSVKTTLLKKGSTADVSKGEVVMPEANAQPQLTFKAYAIQKDNTGTAAEAWEKIPKN